MFNDSVTVTHTGDTVMIEVIDIVHVHVNIIVVLAYIYSTILYIWYYNFEEVGRTEDNIQIA